MISEERQIKHTGGRPRKAVKKEIVKGIRFTKAEYFIVKQKASKTGTNVCNYIREMAINGKIISQLSEDERNYVRQLIGMANNLNQLTKKAHQEGLFSVIFLLEKYKNLVYEILEKIKAKYKQSSDRKNILWNLQICVQRSKKSGCFKGGRSS